MHSNMCASTTSLTLTDYVRLVLGTYWPSIIVSNENEKSRTYPLSKMFFGFLEESGYMHLQTTKPDTAGSIFLFCPRCYWHLFIKLPKNVVCIYYMIVINHLSHSFINMIISGAWLWERMNGQTIPKKIQHSTSIIIL